MAVRSKSSGGPRDRRANSRVDFEDELLLRDEEGRIYRGSFGNISLRGLLFHGNDALPALGTILSGTLILGTISLPFKGAVIHAMPGRGVAIRFQEMDIECFSHLRRLVSLNLGDSDTIDDEFLADR
ncbi:MAG: PilZ domain-containing protein [Magnetococcales bacterium]|nr:PilZ domain-containing protein [Magnetococcales bacterium]